MTGSNYETFFAHDSFAVVGHKAKKNFPALTYRGLKRLGKTVYPVDPTEDEIEGDRAYHSLAELPRSVEAVVVEVPRDETRQWVAQAADAGIKDVWVHMQRETPEALELAREKGLNVRSGSCAVMYVNRGRNYHALHRWIMKRLGKF